MSSSPRSAAARTKRMPVKHLCLARGVVTDSRVVATRAVYRSDWNCQSDLRIRRLCSRWPSRSSAELSSPLLLEELPALLRKRRFAAHSGLVLRALLLALRLGGGREPPVELVATIAGR